MYNNYDPTENKSWQSFSSVLLTKETEETNEENKYDCSDLAEWEIDVLKEPLTERIWNTIKEILLFASAVTIKEVVEKTGLKDSPVRNRMNLLVKAGRLDLLPGGGRSPALYFLSSDSTKEQDRKLPTGTTDCYAPETSKDVDNEYNSNEENDRINDEDISVINNQLSQDISSNDSLNMLQNLLKKLEIKELSLLAELEKLDTQREAIQTIVDLVKNDSDYLNINMPQKLSSYS